MAQTASSGSIDSTSRVANNDRVFDRTLDLAGRIARMPRHGVELIRRSTPSPTRRAMPRPE